MYGNQGKRAEAKNLKHLSSQLTSERSVKPTLQWVENESAKLLKAAKEERLSFLEAGAREEAFEQVSAGRKRKDLPPPLEEVKSCWKESSLLQRTRPKAEGRSLQKPSPCGKLEKLKPKRSFGLHEGGAASKRLKQDIIKLLS